MSLLKKATNQTAYLKAGILGFAGSGKTYTASAMAIGLAKEVGNGRPVAFFDTETGSDYMIKRFEEAGVELLVAKTRSFKDLITFMREAEETCSVAIIDSISHVWSELMESYARKLGRKHGLQFQDWGKIKAEWRQFTDAYLNSKLHVVLCGRAGYEYEHETDDDGKKELIKTGTKMKAETEMGYEPSLLLEMVRIKKSEITRSVKDRGWSHRCVVLKDRSDKMNGQEIENPSFESFRPVLNFLNIGGDHLGVDTSSSSDEMFDRPDMSRLERDRQMKITEEEIKEVMIETGLDGSSNDVKVKRVAALKNAFGTSSWTAITSMRLREMREGLNRLRRDLGIGELVDAPKEHLPTEPAPAPAKAEPNPELGELAEDPPAEHAA